ncbi:NAD-dependent epimerase/dehydratase family protein [Micromonospora arborensis]|uniref:NAD-dependent epimerase/dehydratase family protein n=1 Tax=Micromonospora arborensis TaxID=2116518 RepID=UPI00370FAE48
MKLLVLGGTRFAVRAIVDALLDGHDVTVLNRGTQPLWDGRIRQLVADRDDAGQMTDAWTAAYDGVVDVSGAEPGHVRRLPRAKEIPRYVFISSAAVYSRESAAPPFREDDRADGDAIWGGYGEAKATCERLLREALPARSLTVLRPPYVYGPHNTEQREQFLWARMGGRPADLRAGRRPYPDPVLRFADAGRHGRAAVEGRLPAGTPQRRPARRTHATGARMARDDSPGLVRCPGTFSGSEARRAAPFFLYSCGACMLLFAR